VQFVRRGGPTRPGDALRAVVAAVAILTAVAVAPRPAAAESIKRIEVVGNTKTETETVMLIADIEVGDDYTPQVLEEVRIRLVSSELFKEVIVRADKRPGGVKITINAKDKHSWVIAPTFYNQPGNVGGGLGFAESNLFGENKKLLMYGQIATSDSFFLGGYIDPSIAGTRFRWQADVFLRREEVTEYGPPAGFLDETVPVRISTMNYLNGGLKAGFSLFRAFVLEARLRGAYVYYDRAKMADGATCADVVDPDDVELEGQCDEVTREAPLPGTEGWDVTTEIITQLDRRANWYGITTGSRWRAAYERALPQLGSDFRYWYGSLSVFQGWRGLLFGADNFVLEAGVGGGKDIPFQQEYTSGGVGLRGYSNRQFRGDFKVGGSLEYSIPLVTIGPMSFRLLGFYDTAYTKFIDRDDVEDDFRNYLPDAGSAFGPWKNGVGGGIRLYFRSIVIPLLGFDVGYGLEGGDYQTYFAVGLTEI
jgi:outer membrane protein assembly factor BamA